MTAYPKNPSGRCLAAALAALLAPSLHAANYYWDTNSTTAGLGNTAGTWGTSTYQGTVPSGNLDGTAATANTATTSSDSIQFGTNNLALGSTASTIGVAASGITINAIVIGAAQGSQGVTFSGGGGTLTMAGTTPTIATNHAATDTMGAVIAGTVGMVKGGAGTLVLTGSNSFTGGLTINGGGTLQAGDGTTGSLTSQALTFNNGGGVFHVKEAAGSTQAMGALTFSTTGVGDDTVQSTYAGSGNSALTFSSLAARGAGAAANFVISGGTNGTTNKITLTGAASGALLDKGLFFGGGSYAANDSGGFVRAYGSGDTNYLAAPAGATMGSTTTSSNADLTTGNITAQTTTSANTINLHANNIAITSGNTLSTSGLLSSGGGSATVSGGILQAVASGAEMVVRVNGGTDALTISANIQNNTTASAFTKTGAGTLTLSGTNTHTGTTTINGGILALSGGAAIADTDAVVLANAAGATLQLNANETIGSLAGGGLAGGNVNVQGNILTLANANSLTFGGALTGTSGGGLTLTSGTLTLSNKNTFPGTITLNGTSQLTLSYGSNGTSATPAISSGGTISMANGTSLLINPTAQVAAGVAVGALGGSTSVADVISNPIVVSSGTATLKQGTQGSARYLISGGVTGGTSGAETLSIVQGFSGGNAERTTFTVSGVIQNGSGGTLGVSADFKGASTTGQGAFICLSGQNTFTGPIVVSNTKGLTYDGGVSTYHGAWFVIGGEITSGFSDRTVTPGSGYLGGGNYSGSISLATGAILDYASSASQTLGGIISGTGNLVKEGSGTLTLAAVNTYTGGTTVVSGGGLVLGATGGLKFVVTDSTANKVTGSGSATFNGAFTVDTSAVTVLTGTWTLVDVTTRSFGATFGLTGFTGPVSNVFTKVSGSQSWSFNTTTGLLTLSSLLPSSACAMLTCDFGTLGQATVTEANATASLTVSPSQSVTALAPVFTLSPKATISPASGSTQNFTTPVVYRVTAENGTSYKDYTVSVLSYAAWGYSGSLFVLTDTTGANLPPSASETNFPLLVRFNSGNFPFAQAAADGHDIRFFTPAGAELSYEIEQWDAVNSRAAVWVKIPTITGNARQEIKMYWGKADAPSETNGPAVFNAANGYCTVMHLNGNVVDSTGLIAPVNAGATSTTATPVIGSAAMNLAGGDINASGITNFPSGTNPTSTGEVWIRARQISSGWCMPLAWGNKNAYGWNTWIMQIGFWGSPTVLPAQLTCRGPAQLSGATALASGQWYHVVYTNTGGTGKLYVNGALDGTASGGSVSITSPESMAMTAVGGDADVDEARISSVARSADWVKMEYENQKPQQTLVGNLVQTGSTFSASPPSVTMNENTPATLTGQAGGAQKVYWCLVQNGVETVLAADQFSYTVSPGRVTGNQSMTIRFKGIYPSGIQTVDIPITVIDTIPDPVFTLTPSTTLWDGRQTMTVTPVITNLAAMQAAGFGTLNATWSVSGVAVAKTVTGGTPGVLTLTRSQGSGPMTVTLTLDNGGALVSNSTAVTVQEPVTDAWLQRTPGAAEKAVNNQFYARDPNTNKGTIIYNGTQSGSPNSVFLKIYTTDTGSDVPYASYSQALGTGGTYAFSAPIDAGKVTYKAVYGTTTGGVDTVVATVTNLVCGDAYIIEGQSNALAIDSLPADATNSNWIRTYGWTTATWGNAVRNGGDFLVGYWGYDLADYLQSTRNMPICIITGAVGGTRIDQHQPNPAGHTVAGSSYSIYANLLNRVIGANLTYGIRGIFWHQGENNSGAAAPTGDWDYKSYRQYFVDMAAAWKQDYPNFQRYIVYQVMPSPCSMGPKGDQLRDVQRTLPSLFSKMHVLDTLGISGYLGCHFTAAGYQGISDRVAPLVDQDFYGAVPGMSVTAPVLQNAYYTSAARTEIALQFDQNMSWNSFSTANYWLDKVGSKITSGSVSGNIVKLQLASAGTATSTLDYLEDTHWAYTETTSSLLYGANGIPALTFADVPIAAASPYYTWTSAQGLTTGVNDGPMNDPGHRGVCNLLRFALGGTPATTTPAILPVSSRQSGNLVFEYDRGVASRPPNATQIVEYGNDLSGWTPVTVPYSTSGPVTVTLGAATDHVKVVVPTAGTKVFARLRVIAN